MPILHIVILAFIQGATEFLPISSSGHLALTHGFLNPENTANYQKSALILDISVHIGTLFAVLLYFRHDLLGFLSIIGKNNDENNKNIPLCAIIASIPVIIVGFFVYMAAPDILRSVEITAWCTLIFAILLWVADKKGKTNRTLDDIKVRDALYIGIMQAIALIPGTSRSGITMTGARMLGFNRVESARFSMFLAIIAISGAGTLGGIDIINSEDTVIQAEALIAAAISFIVSWVSIAFMMKWLEKASFKPFIIYRIFLGIILLSLLYNGTLDNMLG
jgi:undecaprenyl-diphosphatase